MKNKRVLVVDDSYLYQQLFSNAIDAADGLEVVGIAANGKIALEKIHQLVPDLVLLDILMPEMDGIQTLMAIRKDWPSVRAIMVSSLTSEGSEAALDALALGACEYANKPDTANGIESIKSELKIDLVPKVLALCGVEDSAFNRLKTVARNKGQQLDLLRQNTSSACGQGGNIDIVAIGISTGGPDALSKILSNLPADIGVPIVIVQHMPPQFTSKLAKRLNSVSALEVVEATANDKLLAGKVFIAPGDYHMVLTQSDDDVVIELNQEALENSCRPSVDPLFRSIPKIYGKKCLGVILTGMGGDGLFGCEVLVKAGCPVIVQDKETSIVWGMPKLVLEAGLAQRVVPIEHMANEIVHWVGRQPIVGSPFDQTPPLRYPIGKPGRVA